MTGQRRSTSVSFIVQPLSLSHTHINRNASSNSSPLSLSGNPVTDTTKLSCAPSPRPRKRSMRHVRPVMKLRVARSNRSSTTTSHNPALFRSRCSLLSRTPTFHVLLQRVGYKHCIVLPCAVFPDIKLNCLIEPLLPSGSTSECKATTDPEFRPSKQL